MTKKFLRRMRLKAYFFEKEDDTITEREEKYGFKSRYIPPASKNLIDFENDLIKLISEIKFRRVKDKFQDKLKEDIARINKIDKVIVSADKTTNLYTMTKEEYDEFLINSISANYKKADPDIIYEINDEAKEIAQELKIDDRVNVLPTKEAYFTLKDHKNNFKTNPKGRLINPTKSEIGKISKIIVQKINIAIRSKQQHVQWTDASQVIEWFNTLPRNQYKLLKFDVIEFYPSITEELLDTAIRFAQQFITISDKEIKIIKNAAKSVLNAKDELWTKSKPSNPLFDITMGGFHGAEICELVGLLMLDGLNNIVPEKRVGLYRDDGLCAVPHQSGYKNEKLKSEMHKFAKSLGLRLDIEEPSLEVSFLDLNLDLKRHIYSPFRKENNKILYVHAHSNHPKVVIKEIPKMVSKRITNRSSNQEEFQKVANEYNNALKKSGYKEEIQYVKNEEPRKKKRNRKRNIIWYNPPYCKSVETKIGWKFNNLIKKHFTKENPLSKIFNKNSIKLSYSCMNNMGKIINSHNKKILNKATEEKEETCNCTKECPLNKEGCRRKNVVYEATVKTKEETRTYIGLTSSEFKKRHSSHKTDFKYEKYRNSTTLSEYIWKNKDENKEYEINWNIIDTSKELRNGQKECKLCLKESLAILKNKKGNGMNKRTEILNTCRHASKFLLKKWVTKDEQEMKKKIQNNAKMKRKQNKT